MNTPIKILHITPHLGGGVGKALSGLVIRANLVKSPVQHTIACLEEPVKSLFVDKAIASGCEVVITPNNQQLDKLISDADIVQLEWWNHPKTLKCLCSHPFPPMRLLVWSHISGLDTPIIPQQLISSSQKCLFTSPCSYEAKQVNNLSRELTCRLDVVNSCGGFTGFPMLPGSAYADLRAGYIGSLNFSKLHPRFVEFLSAVPDPNFSVKMIGDALNEEILTQQCEQADRKGLLDFCGFKEDVVPELMSINTLIYLLNPGHYGTTENALLETMAMGIVPIVLNNPAERRIVDHMKTGFIIESEEDLAQTIDWIKHNSEKFKAMGKQACHTIRERFSVGKMESALNSHYQDLLSKEKETISFIEIFGNDPSEWFLSCQKAPEIFTNKGINQTMITNLSMHGLIEKTKGTAIHFHKYFPENLKLQKWAGELSKISNDHFCQK